MSTVAKHLIIHGRVQGVSYRAWMVGAAQARNVSGWVRNIHDGTVEAVVSGDEADLQDLINSCYDGPAMANVTGIDISDAEPPASDGFEQKPSL